MENTVMNELAAKAREAKSAGELLALAKENGMEDHRADRGGIFRAFAQVGRIVR